MKIVICKNCKKEKEHCANGLCRSCYKKIIWKNRKIKCVQCGRIRPMHAKGMCPTCYSKTFGRTSKETYQARKLYGLDYETWKDKTRSCVICGFYKIVDLHHLDKNHENRDSSNLIGLCPNHHRMLHKSETSQQILSQLSARGYKV